MCEDWITEKYIDDVRNAAKKNYAVIKRMRELVDKFEQEPIDEMVNYHLVARRILVALDGEQ
jgi:hypothetical protein